MRRSMIKTWNLKGRERTDNRYGLLNNMGADRPGCCFTIRTLGKMDAKTRSYDRRHAVGCSHTIKTDEASCSDS